MTIGFELEPIGYVKNDVQDVRFKDWKNLVSCLVIDSRYAKALDGLEEFSHLLVITRLHLPGRVLLKRHPRNRQDLPVVGVFATRSQMRPNRLGLHVVRLMERKKEELLVQGLDTLNGTPLIDIKPYIPEQDVVMSAMVPAWVHKLHDL
jgi:tRNA (adenine37-N6)-methyltransferase